MNNQRRRLSMLNGGEGGAKGFEHDGRGRTNSTSSIGKYSDTHMSSVRDMNVGSIASFAAETKPGKNQMTACKINQDSYWCEPNFAGDTTKFYFGVCDGHGMFGERVSERVKIQMPTLLREHPSFEADPPSVLQEIHPRIHEELQTKTSIDVNYSGTTVVTTYIHGGRLYVSNCGDSRMLLANDPKGTGQFKTSFATKDHKPDDPEERQRIEKKGRVEACR